MCVCVCERKREGRLQREKEGMSCPLMYNKGQRTICRIDLPLPRGFWAQTLDGKH